MHALWSYDQTTEKIRTELRKFRFRLTAEQVKDLFDDANVNNFLSRRSKRPEFKQSLKQVNREEKLLLQVVFDADLELGIESRQGFNLVKRD